MNKDVIKNAKENYTRLMQIKKELKEVKKELLIQQQNKETKNILRIISDEENKIPSDEEILKYSFYNAEQDDSTCNIYVFIGAYRRTDKVNDIKVSDYNKADYFVYQNLEKNFSGMVIYPFQQQQFEIENIILKFKNSNNIKEKFYNLQSIYFNEYLNNEFTTQDKILEKLKNHL